MDYEERARIERERERGIPAEVVRECGRSVHLMAAARWYIQGADDAWSRCFDGLRADCERLAGECERRGLVMTLPVAEWPAAHVYPGDAMTREQAAALLHAADTQRLLFDAVCRLMMFDPIVVWVAKIDEAPPG